MKYHAPKLAIIALTAFPAIALAEPRWEDACNHIIAKHQSYPRSAQIRGDQGTTRIKILVDADGRISQVLLAQSSGSAILDRQAREVVMDLGKLPAPPIGTTSLLIPIVWRLADN